MTESSGNFSVCVVTDREVVQDINVTVVAREESASPNMGKPCCMDNAAT